MSTPSDLCFPPDFVFGGATAAYQVEGATRAHGKGKTAWDDFLAAQGRFSPDPASDFYHRYPEDLALCERFGLTGIRVSIAWTRIFAAGDPRTAAPNPAGVAFYHALFAACAAHGVTPYVTLCHFDTPEALCAQGGFLNRTTIDAFEAYARYCFAEFPEVEHWFTFNEIGATAEGSYITGTWPRGEKYRLDLAFQLMHNMMVAHARAVAAYRALGLPGQIGIVHNLEPKYPYDPASLADAEAARAADVINNRFVLDATLRGCYAPETLDTALHLAHLAGGELEILEEDLAALERAVPLCQCLGVNTYKCQFLRALPGGGENDIHHNGTGDKGSSRWALAGVGEALVRPGTPTTDWDWIIHSEGLFDLLLRIKNDYPNYGRILITENGMGYKDELVDGVVDDAPRIDYLEQHLSWLLRAMQGGVNVGGYFVWSLQDQFSWTNGYDKRYGLFYVDFETQERTPKASAYWLKRVTETGRL